MSLIEYGFRQAIRDVVIGILEKQKPLYDALAAAIERRMGPLIEEQVRHHFAVRLGTIEATERDRMVFLLDELEVELSALMVRCSSQVEIIGQLAAHRQRLLLTKSAIEMGWDRQEAMKKAEKPVSSES